MTTLPTARPARRRRLATLAFGAAVLLSAAGPAQAEDGTFAMKMLTPETALKAAQTALADCRKAGYQVGVAVVDRMGVPQVLLRDRFAGAHTVEVAIRKAWSAASFAAWLRCHSERARSCACCEMKFCWRKESVRASSCRASSDCAAAARAFS